jgi:hypothetical protein
VLHLKFCKTFSLPCLTEQLQCVFNELLPAYREKLLKEHVENFNDLPDVEQYLLTRMYNFFYGLHLTVNIADIVNKVFLENQTDHLFDNDNSMQDKSEEIERCMLV